MSRVTCAKPRGWPRSSVRAVRMTLAQKREPSRRRRQPSSSWRPWREAAPSCAAGAGQGVEEVGGGDGGGDGRQERRAPPAEPGAEQDRGEEERDAVLVLERGDVAVDQGGEADEEDRAAVMEGGARGPIADAAA